MRVPPNEFVKIITGFEGTKRKGYVPKDNSGKIIGSSGVTIGKGLDLGAQNEESLRSMGLNKDLFNKLKPYLGKKGNDALNVADTLDITPEEEAEINTKVTQKYWNDFHRNFKSYVGYDADELPAKSQFAVASRFFNSGSSIFRGTNFTKQLRNRDWKGAAKNLETWFNPKGKFAALVPRVRQEAELFRAGFEESQLQPPAGDNFIAGNGSMPL
jgi:GH24 family phage-related lysozyme (muramidase)